MFRVFILVTALLTLFSFSTYAGDIYNEPVALVLAGGGARGAYQVGVWKALLDLGVEIGAIYGVSVGAINGAMMAMNDFELVSELWMKLEKSNVMSVNDEAERVFSGDFSLKDLSGTFQYLYENGGINVSPLEELLFQYIDENTIRNSGIDFGLAAYSLTDNTEKSLYLADIPQGLLVDYILASANFPLFQRKVINGEEFVDGGVSRNMIVDMVDGDKFPRAVLVSLNMYSPQDILDYLTGYSDYDFEITYISPRSDPGSLLDFEPENSIELIKMGYLDCLHAFGELKGNDLYIYGDDPVKKLYLSLDAEHRRQAVELLEIDRLPGLSYFEYEISYDRFILSEILKEADSPVELIEKYAIRQGVDKLQLYSSSRILDKTVENYLRNSHNSINHNRYLDCMSYLSLESKNLSDKLSFDDSRYGVYVKSFSEFTAGDR